MLYSLREFRPLPEVSESLSSIVSPIRRAISADGFYFIGNAHEVSLQPKQGVREEERERKSSASYSPRISLADRCVIFDKNNASGSMRVQ